MNREGKPISDKPKLNDQQTRNNLTALYELCAAEEKPNRIALGEMLRELGRFDEALAILDSIEDDEENTVSLIAECARQKDSRVREVWRSQYDF